MCLSISEKSAELIIFNAFIIYKRIQFSIKKLKVSYSKDEIKKHNQVAKKQDWLHCCSLGVV